MDLKIFSYYKIIFKNEPFLLIRHLFFNILYTISIIFPGYFTSLFFDHLSLDSTINPTFWLFLAILLGVYVERTAFQFLTLVTDGWYRLTISADLRKSILQDLLNKPGAQALPKEISPGDAITRFRDDVSVLSLWPKFVNNEIAYTIFSVISLIILITINISFTLIVIIPLSFVFLITYLVRQRIEKYRFNFQKMTGRSTESLGEIFSSVQAIMVANAESNVASYYREINDMRRGTAQKDRAIRNILEIIASNAASIGTRLLLLIIFQALPACKFTIGDLTLYSYLISWISDYVGHTGNFWATYKQTHLTYTRIFVIQDNLTYNTTNHVDITYLR